MRIPWLQARLPLLALSLWDGVVVAVAYGLIHRLRLGSWWGQTLEALAFGSMWLVGSFLLGRYSREVHRPRLWRRRLQQTLLVAALMLVAIQLNSWVLRVLMEPTRFRGFLLPWAALVVLGSLLGQHLLRPRSPGEVQPWLLVVEGPKRAVLEAELAAEQQRWGQPPPPVHFCAADALPTLLQQQVAGVALSPMARRQRLPHGTLWQARRQGLSCWSLQQWCEAVLHRIPPELLDEEALVLGEGFGLHAGSVTWGLKRFGDVLLAALLLLLTAPVLLLAMVVVKLEDGGPVFYRQRRTGLYGAPIWITKLRTMAADAEAEGMRWATAGDSRITLVGRWLRRWRIDELPQLWNVLNGSMSLIGPRPERPELEAELEAQIPHYRLRHWLPPGLSGWAQVCFPYGASVADSRSKLSYDLYYLRNANVLLDLLILAMTLRLVAGGRGAVAQTKA